MKSIQILAAAVLAALLWMPGSEARETPQPSPFLLAQYDRRQPTCRDDEKELPRGSMICRDGRVMLCNPRGAWEDTAKPC